ncbi:TPA: uracil-DNA glycosylase [Candidatus Poribacteria bacterium]|jgi:DNA polymerase|nr:uracil-DNA glycosylase [Candidatus Poribacteria bacterium]HIB90266.1 uracil-DNA glycosylase [Candidatus Poribacteria bacterium]HIC03322.1 uracil-DNA glycosylase [Candidatus Poribacteria bacterium]HIC17639.1 uracil-DNA glycosylase [Candidatus Poribacteria bacterium]HIM10352.1 uracil-DNA glycosylase [Candidatus Poribacteria bacterium]
MANSIQEYLQVISTVREYVEEQMQLGFTEILDPEHSKLTEVDYNQLRQEANGCKKCELHATRTNVVFGTGNENADLMFIGEAPGRDEDEKGEPFVGRAGQLLTKVIEAMELTRDKVYIANVIKCRPPNNRNPKHTEIESCEPYLIRQIELIKPKVICALGTFAAQMLLRTEAKISALRGHFHEYRGIKVMPTYHPAYLLRNPGGKREVWEDMQKVMAELNLPIP